MEETSALSLQNVWQAMRLHWGVVLLVSALLFAGTVALIFSLTPVYTADALLLLAPVADELTSNATDRNFAITDPMFVRSETAIVQSDGICRDVIEQLHLDTLPEFQPKPGIRAMLGLGSHTSGNRFLTPREIAISQVLSIYQKRLTVFNDGRNKTVDIAFTASDPRLAAKIANAHAQAYMRRQGARRTGAQEQDIGWLKSEVEARAREAKEADALVQQYQLKNGIVGTRDDTVIEQRLEQLNTQLVDAQRQLSTQAALLGVIRDIRGGADPSKAAPMLQSDTLTELLKNRMQAETNVASLEKQLTPDHPTLIKAQQDLASINNELDKELKRVESEAQAGVSSATRQVADLTAATRAEAASKLNEDRLVAGLPGLVSAAQVKRTVFENVLNRYQTRISEQDFVAPTASVVSEAVAPADPSFPKTPLLLAIGAMLSLIGGSCSALLVHLFRPLSMDLHAVADAIGVRPLVSIPRYRKILDEDGVIRMKDPRLFIESIRSGRNAIFQRRDSRNIQTCLLTSMRPGQGKSLVAMSLARAIARGGTRTLFMEMDLRCPSASALARRDFPTRGMAAVLEGRATFGDVVVRDEKTGLHMLFAERSASRSVDQLTALKFAALVAKLRSHYEAIIIDSPPVGVVSDALTIAPVVDQIVIVAKDRETSVTELARAARLLKERGSTVTGLILTGVDPKELSTVDKPTAKRYLVGLPEQPRRDTV
jgi:capsular exopolysaccharide synthesis family protein